MERIIFVRLSEEILSKGGQNKYLLNSIEELKDEYTDQKFNNCIRYVYDFLNERDASYSYEYIKRINQVNMLLGKYWKVSLLGRKDYGELYPSRNLCYMYPYAMNTDNHMLFAIVSTISFDDYTFSKRRVFAEDSFNFMSFGDTCAGLIFEEVDKEEMIEHAKGKVEDMLSDRIKRNEAHKTLVKPANFVIGTGEFFKEASDCDKILKESAIEDIIEVNKTI